MGRDKAAACNRELGAELRKRREAAGMSGAAIANYTGWDKSKVSRVESGHIGLSPVDVLHYLGACQVWAPEAKEMLALCETAQRKLGHWLDGHSKWLAESGSSLIFHEATADRSVTYEPLYMPGLLQTADYARVWLARAPSEAAEAAAMVQVRMDRQQVLHRPQRRPFAFFVHEQALRLRVGSAAIMQEQLLHLVLMSNLPHVMLRVVPASAGEQAILGGPFRLFEFRDHQPLVYLDGIATGFFLEDRDYVDQYRELLPELDAIAMGEGQSREFAAALADEHDRGSHERNGGIYCLEEEQL
ncbi:MAG: helix-turn-helix domain-containing protein [Actinophytocola sp.]|uniref:helix-turn-helix domain-containing protein n=1 Tax=Actinophytocola sp. TaxID=1872138 RepID=UPI001321D0B3|nr:helix-turn-helix transcriptional regulator [Actinophytocola sp.]MPZ80428.1 helix-turn-helix domain-containing protein [Actinophytocola sp.]